MKRTIGKRHMLGLVGAVALSLSMAVPALASDGTTATVTGGELTITNPSAAVFAGTAVTGLAQTTDAALDAFSVSDLTGSGAGWHVTAQASTFTGVSHNLAVGSLEMSQPTVAAATGTTSPDPTITGVVPYTIDNGAVSIASAALNEGMGTYDFSATTLTLALPDDVFADTYASTVTISATTAP